MTSEVLNQRVAAAINAVNLAFDAVFDAGVEAVDGRDAISWIREFAVINRRAGAVEADLAGSITQRGHYVEDGHANPKVMIRHLAKVSGAEAKAEGQVARLMQHLPIVADAYRTGRIGTEQIRVLARLHTNPRVAPKMSNNLAGSEADPEGWFLRQADQLSFRQFTKAVHTWANAADPDGAEPVNDRNHTKRDTRLEHDPVTNGWHLTGSFSSLQGLSLKEIFDHYSRAETLADWAKARAEFGDATTAADLPRTDAQRRADALFQIFQDAVGNPETATPVGFIHNIKWTARAYERMVRRDDGDTTDDLNPGVDGCTAMDGTPVEMSEAFANSLLNQFRRVVVDAKGVVIDMGTARTFRGGARHAARMNNTTCYWPGCEVDVASTQTDHLHQAAKGGRTEQANAAPACGRHNRWKEHGYITRRDPETVEIGVYRPDGSRVP